MWYAVDLFSLLVFSWTLYSRSLRLPSAFVRLRWTRALSRLYCHQENAHLHIVDTTKFLFVGGKGGVGKTTTSSAIAIASSDQGLRTLVISTDPAHSLGDALATDLRSNEIVRIATETNLWASEVDVQAALNDFKISLGAFDSARLAQDLGIPKEIIKGLGVDEIADVLTNPPPGIDEILALVKIFQYAEEDSTGKRPKFDRIVVDTAPTGHTLRLLQLPRFLDTFTGRLLQVRAQITSAVQSFQSLFGGGDTAQTGSAAGLKGLLGKLDTLQTTIQHVQRTLRDQQQTQFVVVTIPTALAVAETKRLVASLGSEGISISGLVCNQVVPTEAGDAYVGRRAKEQQRCFDKLIHYAVQHSQFYVKQENALVPQQLLEVTQIPLVDTEATGVYGLRYFASLAHRRDLEYETDHSKKLTIFGGKGGVGKTTCAASYALQLADGGLRTLVISSDPAHSLGDALQAPLTGTPTLVSTPGSLGELWAMEIDPAKALGEFKAIAQEARDKTNFAGRSSGGSGGFLSSLGLPDISAELQQLLLGVQEPPPGTDEIVALAKVVDYLDQEIIAGGKFVRFDRVVLDTAPTGHTLRMLQLPEGLLKLTAKLRVIRERTTGTDSSDRVGVDKLAVFERKMERLQQLLRDPAQCEFTVVTIPTELAVAETVRLLDALQQEKVSARRLLINQVLPLSSSKEPSQAAGDGLSVANDKYLKNVRNGQSSALRELESLSQQVGVPLIKVPYFDTEVRTVYGLRMVSNVLLPKSQEKMP